VGILVIRQGCQMPLEGGILFLWSPRIAHFIGRRIRISKMSWALLTVDLKKWQRSVFLFETKSQNSKE